MSRSVMPHKEKIRRLRQERGWTQEKLAEKVGCDTRNIQRAEQPGCRVALFTLAEIAQALGVEMHGLIVPDFLGGDDPQLWLKRAIQHDLDGNYGLAIDGFLKLNRVMKLATTHTSNYPIKNSKPINRRGDPDRRFIQGKRCPKRLHSPGIVSRALP